MRCSVVVLVSLAAASCGYPQNHGKMGSCFSAENDDPATLDRNERSEARTVRPLIEADEALDPPAEFVECSVEMPIMSAFIDNTGEHLWLALEAEYESKELVPRHILSLVEENATLEVRQTRGWNTSDSVFIANGTQPVLAMQSAAALDGSRGALRVEDQGVNALPALGSCGTSTTHALKFIDDDGEESAGNGETRALTVGGVAFLATNVFSIEYDWHGCTDGPFPASQVTWVAHDNSL